MTVLNFPSNPQNGDTYTAPNGTLYTYDGVKWVVTTTTITAEQSINFVQDSVAPIFENIQGNGISFTYDAETNQLSASVTGSANTGDIGFNDNIIYNTISNGMIYIDPSNDSGNTGYIAIPGPAEADTTLLSIGNQMNGGVQIQSGNLTWQFVSTGDTVLPYDNNSKIAQNYTYTRSSFYTAPDLGSYVIWTSSEWWISSTKLVIQVEASTDQGPWHTQSCEAIISTRVFVGDAEPVMTVYGVVHTSDQPLVTFTVRRNAGGYTELVGTSEPGMIHSPNYHIYSVELSTAD